MKTASFGAAHSRVAPRPKTALPMIMVVERPYESAILPANRLDVAAGMRMADTTAPCFVGDKDPKLREKVLIEVIGPMVPVSRPNKRPPIDTIMDAT